jgi:hypothetical protein
VKLVYGDYAEVSKATLVQCSTLQDRFAILDTWSGDLKPDSDVVVSVDPQLKKNMLEANRDAWEGDLKYGAVYYPFVKTTFNYYVYMKDDLTASNVLVSFCGNKQDLCKYRDANAALFQFVQGSLKQYFITLPPSGAVAGVYATTDVSRGVWKAPANVPLTGVSGPVVNIDEPMQQMLTQDSVGGKSINLIRAFRGKGTLVWGARTLAGNDNEWRYVPVRRFSIMVEESLKKSTFWVVFEPNDANSWVKVRGMIENYLTKKWRDGALAGATPKDAFFVRCGLGTTMTHQDILEGRMNVEIGMALIRPAEFVIIKFSQLMQTA